MKNVVIILIIFRTFMVQDSERGPSNSFQEVTECLCDDKMMPLRQNLCFRAIPHYEVFVGKREPKVKRRLVKRDSRKSREKGRKRRTRGRKASSCGRTTSKTRERPREKR